jgi:hypothetical protein
MRLRKEAGTSASYWPPGKARRTARGNPQRRGRTLCEERGDFAQILGAQLPQRGRGVGFHLLR